MPRFNLRVLNCCLALKLGICFQKYKLTSHEKIFCLNLKKSVRFWDLTILWIWDFATTWLTKMADTTINNFFSWFFSPKNGIGYQEKKDIENKLHFINDDIWWILLCYHGTNLLVSFYQQHLWYQHSRLWKLIKSRKWKRSTPLWGALRSSNYFLKFLYRSLL